MINRNVLAKPKYNVIRRFEEDGMTYFCESLNGTRKWNIYWKASDQEKVTIFDEDNIVTHTVKVNDLHKFIKENFNVH